MLKLKQLDPLGKSFHTLLLIILVCSFLFSQESYIDSTRIKDPKLAWKLSLIPGLGQIYNEKYIKAAGLIGAQGYLVSRFRHYAGSDNIIKRNTFGWWIFGLYVMGILDAYVDAQLSTFPQDVEKPEDVDSVVTPEIEEISE